MYTIDEDMIKDLSQIRSSFYVPDLSSYMCLKNKSINTRKYCLESLIRLTDIVLDMGIISESDKQVLRKRKGEYYKKLRELQGGIK